MEEPIVSVEGLRYNYGKLVAVDDISFNVEKGEIFSFLRTERCGKNNYNQFANNVVADTERQSNYRRV